MLKCWAKWGGPSCGTRLASVCQSMGREMRISTAGLRKQIDVLMNHLEGLGKRSHTDKGIEQIRDTNMKIEELQA